MSADAASPTTSAPAAYPVVFGAEGHQLLGWVHPAVVREGRARDCVVVMCNPLGYDAICTHRHYRALAAILADAGFTVLRYDHHGTGDSAGTDEDPLRVQTWIADVSTAVEFAKRVSGASQASLFGVRMGGTLALAASAAAPLVQSVVAWAAFPSGPLYLREMRALRSMRDAEDRLPVAGQEVGDDLVEEAAGYLFTRSTIDELSGLSLLNIAKPPAPHILLLARDDVPVNDKLARHLIKIGCDVTQPMVPGYAEMMLETFNAVVPTAALAEIRIWLENHYPLQKSKQIALAAATPHLIAGSGDSESNIVESPVFFGAGNQFFGIVSESSGSPGARAATGIIFVNVGSNHHIGPNRMYVAQARYFASLGFVSLRMDIGGVGDSPASPGQRDNHLNSMHSVADVHAAILFLRNQKQVTRIVLMGVCSGAFLSYHAAAADPSIASIVLINQQIFTWQESDSRKLRIGQEIRPLNFYRKRILSGNTWKRLLKGEINTKLIIAGVSVMLWKRVAIKLAGLMNRRGDKAEGSSVALSVKGTFRKILKQGVNVYLLYSGNDSGLLEMGNQLGRHASSLKNYENFKLELVEGADHTFTPLWAQRRLLDLLSQYLLQLYG